MANKLELKNISVSVENKQVLSDISLSLKKGEVIVLMGPNGAGKSSITKTIMSHPEYKITKGQILLDNEDITNLSADEKAKKGIFLSFQTPIEIPGITLANFLRASYNATTGSNIKTVDFFKLLKEKMSILNMDSKFRSRYLNVGFSGGEKKKVEILQLILNEPDFILLDELDSGLDVDALNIISDAINKLREKKKVGILIITHFNKILNYIPATKTIIIKEGKISKVGDSKLAKEIELKGFN